MAKHHTRQFLKALQFVLPDIAARTVRKAADEETLATGAEQNNRPEPAGGALVRAA